MTDDDLPVSSSASPMSTAAALSTEDETVVAAFDTLLEAEMARGRLAADEIPARIVDGNTVGIAAHLSMAIGGAKVVVALSDLEAARSILFAPSTFAHEMVEVEPREDVPAPLISRADADASRALRSAVFGLLFFPPLGHIWSIVLLSRVLRNSKELTPRGRVRAGVAIVIDGAVGAIAAALAATLWKY